MVNSYHQHLDKNLGVEKHPKHFFFEGDAMYRNKFYDMKQLTSDIIRKSKKPLDYDKDDIRILTTIRGNNMVCPMWSYPTPPKEFKNPAYILDWNSLLLHKDIPYGVGLHKQIIQHSGGMDFISEIFVSDQKNAYNHLTGEAFELKFKGWFELTFSDPFGNKEKMLVEQSSVLNQNPFTEDMLVLMEDENGRKLRDIIYIDGELNLHKIYGKVKPRSDGCYYFNASFGEQIIIPEEYIGFYYERYMDCI